MILDPTNPACPSFLSLKLRIIEQLIADQGKQLLADYGVETPQVCVSTLCVIGLRQPMTVSEIAEALGVIRQTVLQRLSALERQELIISRTDENDRRSRLIKLSAHGAHEFEKIQNIGSMLNAAFIDLNEEVGVNLSEVALKTAEALRRKSIGARMKDAAGRDAGLNLTKLGAEK